jgi:type IV pilus assembly protein PilY1
VWRFDFEGMDAAKWSVGFRGKPLFSATDPGGVPQPITVPPVFVDHPKQGRVVLFGSGKLIDEADSESVQRQTYYGVWDNVKIGDPSADAESLFETVTDADRSRLLPHSINQEPKTDDGGTFYEVITSDLNWDTHLGWLIDLPWDRQRVIYPSVILSSAYVFFSTMVPAAPAGRCDPTTGVGYNFLLEAASGEAPTVPVLDTNGDGKVTEEDKVASGFLTRSDGRDAIIVGGGKCPDGETCDTIEKDCKGNIIGYWVCNTGPQCMKVNLPPASCSSSTVVDRVWKQILTPPTPE